eukprot:scaffold2870_cov92-Isochrysis_galbana.AAC.1
MPGGRVGLGNGATRVGGRVDHVASADAAVAGEGSNQFRTHHYRAREGSNQFRTHHYRAPDAPAHEHSDARQREQNGLDARRLTLLHQRRV